MEIVLDLQNDAAGAVEAVVQANQVQLESNHFFYILFRLSMELSEGRLLGIARLMLVSTPEIIV